MANFYGNGGNNTLTGTAGDDLLYGFEGNDTLLGGAGNDYLYGDGGSDVLRGQAGNDYLFGGAGNDFLYGGDGADYLRGNDGDDTLYGDGDNDILYGHSGNDTLIGGLGRDLLCGGDGNDRLIYTHNGDLSFQAQAWGNGDVDTLTIELTSAQYTETVRQDLLAFLDFVAANTSGGETGGGKYVISSLNLGVLEVENLILMVDGQVVDPATPFGQAVMASDDAASGGENDTIEGDVTSNDTGGNAELSVSLVSGVERGTLTLNSDGTFSFATDEDFDTLAAGQTTTETFSYSVTDGVSTDTANVTITVSGVNDAPIVGAPLELTYSEDDGVVTPDLLVGASDVDDGDILTAQGFTFSGNDTGGFSIMSGQVEIDNSYYNYLAEGESAVVVINYMITDGNGGSILQSAEVTINGVNDAPIVSGNNVVSASEDAASFVFDPLDGVTDPDASDELSASGFTVVSGDGGGLNFGTPSTDGNAPISSKGVVVMERLDAGQSGDTSSAETAYTIDAGYYDYLSAGESEVITVNYTVSDGNGGAVVQSVTVTIVGVNDAPVTEGQIDAEASESDSSFDVNLLSGTSDAEGDMLNAVNVTVQSGDASGIVLSGNTLSVDPAAYSNLDAGQSSVIIYRYDIEDGNGGSVTQTATITINGEGGNTPPIATSPTQIALTEDDAPFVADLLQDIYDDDGDTLFVDGITFTGGDNGGLSVDGTDIDVAPGYYNYLSEGEEEIITVLYTVSDGNGGSVDQTATFTIEGVNDAPVINDILALSAGEDDNAISFDPLVGVADPDQSDTLTAGDFTIVGGDGGGLDFNFDSSGANTAISLKGVPVMRRILFDDADVVIVDGISIASGYYDYLSVGESEVVTFEYLISDGNGGNITRTGTVTINGVNDAPEVIGPLELDIPESQGFTTVNMLSFATDPDANDGLFTQNAVVTGADTGGVFLSTDMLNVDPSYYAYLNDGETLEITVNYDVTDGNGGTAAQTLIVTIVGEGSTNEAPVSENLFNLMNETEGLDTEFSFPAFGNFFDQAFDPDGDNFTVAFVDGIVDGTSGIGGQYGFLYWDADSGDYEYQLDDINPEIQELLDGDGVFETFNFALVDEFGNESDTFTLDIQIDGLTDSVYTDRSESVDLSFIVQTYSSDAFGENFLNAMDGDDNIELLSGTEIISYLNEFDGQTFMAGAGDDQIILRNDFMGADGGAGEDTLDMRGLANLVTGEDYRLDMVAGVMTFPSAPAIIMANFENVEGSSSSDVINVSGANNFIRLNGGDDTIIVGEDQTSVGDTYIGGIGFDTIVSEFGEELTFDSFDTTGFGNGSGFERIDFATGFIRGTDFDGVNAGSGDNVFNFTGLEFIGIAGSEGGAPIVLSAGSGNDTVTATSVIGSITTGSGPTPTSDIGYSLGAGDDIFFGGSLNDTVYGDVGADNIFGGAGDDIIYGGAGADVMNGGDGDDVFIVDNTAGESDMDVFIGGAGSDLIDNRAGVDITLSNFVATAAETDFINSGSGIEVLDLNNAIIYGTANDNIFDFRGLTILRFRNSDFADVLRAGDGDDTVFASDLQATVTLSNVDAFFVGYFLDGGNDIFVDSGQRTIAYGGAGSDTFVYADNFGEDSIFDFDAFDDNEKIDLSGVTEITDLADLLANHVTVDGADILITDGANVLRLSDVALSDIIDGNDFIF